MEVFRTPALDLEPQMDRTSPVNTVKYFWAMSDYEEVVVPRQFKRDTCYSTSCLEAIADWRKRSDQEARGRVRAIEKTELQVDGRVAIFVLEPHRGFKDKRKFVLLEEQGAWAIENIFSVCFYCDGTGTVAGGVHFGESCTECDSTGWLSDFGFLLPAKNTGDVQE